MRVILRRDTYGSAGSNVANVGDAFPDYGLDVYDWYRDYGYRNIGAVRLVVSETLEVNLIKRFAWWILSIRQAFCLFLEVLIQVQNNSCFVTSGCLYLFLRGLS